MIKKGTLLTMRTGAILEVIKVRKGIVTLKNDNGSTTKETVSKLLQDNIQVIF